jgi:hypothetical protein
VRCRTARCGRSCPCRSGHPARPRCPRSEIMGPPGAGSTGRCGLVTSCSQADCSGSSRSRLPRSCRVWASSWRTRARLRSACPYAMVLLRSCTPGLTSGRAPAFTQMAWPFALGRPAADVPGSVVRTLRAGQWVRGEALGLQVGERVVCGACPRAPARRPPWPGRGWCRQAIGAGGIRRPRSTLRPGGEPLPGGLLGLVRAGECRIH